MSSDNRISVLLDTNVFVAAYWAQGSASARLIQACIDGHVQAHYSKEVKREVMRILRMIKVSEVYIDKVELFWERAKEVKGISVEPIRVEDPDDQKFLEAAAGGQTDFIVTNDDHLLSIGYIGRTEILTPVSVLKMIGL